MITALGENTTCHTSSINIHQKPVYQSCTIVWTISKTVVSLGHGSSGNGGVLTIKMIYSARTKAAAFKVDPELWSTFKSTCAMRGVSVCYVLEGLMQAWIEGQKATATILKPVTVNLTMQHVVKRPRRKQFYYEIAHETYNRKWPPPCHSAEELITRLQKGSREVSCIKKADVVKIADCWACYLMHNNYEGR